MIAKCGLSGETAAVQGMDYLIVNMKKYIRMGQWSHIHGN